MEGQYSLHFRQATSKALTVSEFFVCNIPTRVVFTHSNVLHKRKRRHLRREVTKHVEAGSNVYTDALRSYNDLNEQYIHSVINHAEKYVDGHVHTNNIENFWSLLKRSLKGTYVAVEPFHLFRYLDEQSFRYNKRTGNDLYRFIEVAKSLTGRRLTYDELTANDEVSH